MNKIVHFALVIGLSYSPMLAYEQQTDYLNGINSTIKAMEYISTSYDGISYIDSGYCVLVDIDSKNKNEILQSSIVALSYKHKISFIKNYGKNWLLVRNNDNMSIDDALAVHTQLKAYGIESKITDTIQGNQEKSDNESLIGILNSVKNNSENSPAIKNEEDVVVVDEHFIQENNSSVVLSDSNKSIVEFDSNESFEIIEIDSDELLIDDSILQDTNISKKIETEEVSLKIELNKPMTVRRFYIEKAKLDGLIYTVHGNSNVRMHPNFFIESDEELSEYLKNTVGATLEIKRNGRYVNIKVIDR